VPQPGPTFPLVCLDCRRSYKQALFPWMRVKRGWGFGDYKCPNCGKKAVRLHEHFKAPRSADKKQWEKVRYLIDNGFRFRPIWDVDKGKPIPYPETMGEAIEWVERFKDLSPSRGGPVSKPKDQISRHKPKK
jgi:hypothetical protein